MADSSRNIVLVLLLVGLAIAIFYMMDPTFGGILGAREGFQDAGMQQMAGDMASGMASGPSAAAAGMMPEQQMPILPENNPSSVTGMQVEKFQNGADPMVGQLSAASKALADAMAKQEKFASPKKEMFAGATGQKMKKYEGFENPASTPFPEAAQPANCYPKNQLSPQELLPMDQNSKWAQANPTGQGDIGGKNFLSAGALIGVNTVGQSLRNANQQLRSEPPNPQMQVSIWNQSTIEPDLQRKPLEGF